MAITAVMKVLRKFTMKKLIIFMLVVGILGGGGYYGYSYYQKMPEGPRSKDKLPKLTLKPELIAFAYRKTPKLSAALEALNDQILLIEAEITRLDAIGSEFPRQEKIVDTAKKDWEKTRDELAKSLDALEKEIEAFYVSHLVSAESGDALIAERQPGLLSEVQSDLDQARELTSRLEKPKDTSLTGRLTSLFN